MALSRKTRRYIVSGLIMLFIVVAPLLIFYARGYRYSFQRQVFKKVGMIMLAYEPLGASATVNDQGAPFDLTALGYDRFPDLETGTYKVNVFAENYHTWSKNLEVTPEFVTWARYIILFKKDTSPKNLISRPKITALDISPNNLWLAAAAPSDNGPEITIFSTTDSDKKQKRIILRDLSNEISPSTKVANISFSPDSANLLLTISDENKANYFIVISREDTSGLTPVFLNNFLPNIEQTSWHPSAANVIFAQAQQELYRLSLTGDIVAKKLASQVRGFTPAPSGLYFIRPKEENNDNSEPQASLKRMDLDGSNTETLSYDIELSENYEISVSEKQKIAIVTDSKNLFVHLAKDNKTERIAQGITRAIWGLDSDKEDSTDEILLYSNAHEIYIFDPLIFNSDTITRYTEDITNVAWYPGNYKYIVFTTANKLKIIELDERDRRNVFDIWETDSQTSIEPRSLFTDKDAKHIYLHLNNPETDTIKDLTIR
jgi:hypothetical protein